MIIYTSEKIIRESQIVNFKNELW